MQNASKDNNDYLNSPLTKITLTSRYDEVPRLGKSNFNKSKLENI